MREMTSLIRERASRQGSGARSALIDFAQRHRATWIIAIMGGLLMAGVGAYGTNRADDATLYAYWLILMFVSCAMGAATLDRVAAGSPLPQHRIRLGLRTIIIVTLLMTPIVWVAAALAMDGSWAPDRMVELTPQVALIVAATTMLQQFAYRSPPDPTSFQRQEPALCHDIIVQRLSGAQLYAVQAEDHYVRLHTDRGSTMVLMTMRDAVPYLEPFNGARTHRSWWVAREAIMSVERGGGRALLTLSNGLRVPVSRSHARDLRNRGWY
jgi:hypothetical protein